MSSNRTGIFVEEGKMARDGKGKGVNPYVNHREHKVNEIKRSLTHRARLRRNYFKLLEKEGQNNKSNEQNKGRDGESHGDLIQGTGNKQLHNDNDYEEKFQPKKIVTYGERLEKNKQRKDEARKAKLREVKEAQARVEKRNNEKKKNNIQLSKKTKKGQPVMAPRINQLLEKIKSEKAMP